VKQDRRSRRIAARTRAAQKLPASQDAARPGENDAPAGNPDGDGLAEVIPMPIFDPFAEADKPW
jgi:hypothetical protein